MAYDENDPRRLDQPVPPELVRSDSTGWIIAVVAVLAIIGLVYAMLPPSGQQTTVPRVTENVPRTEAPAKPVQPTTPPTQPEQKPNPPTTPQ
jgi:hypothetical protein